MCRICHLICNYYEWWTKLITKEAFKCLIVLYINFQGLIGDFGDTTVPCFFKTLEASLSTFKSSSFSTNYTSQPTRNTKQTCFNKNNIIYAKPSHKFTYNHDRSYSYTLQCNHNTLSHMYLFKKQWSKALSYRNEAQCKPVHEKLMDTIWIRQWKIITIHRFFR